MCRHHHKICFFINMAERVSIMVCVCSFPSSHLVDVNCRFHVLWNDVDFISISALFYLYIKIQHPHPLHSSSHFLPQILYALCNTLPVTSFSDSSPPTSAAISCATQAGFAHVWCCITPRWMIWQHSIARYPRSSRQGFERKGQVCNLACTYHIYQLALTIFISFSN